jgi:hypothetical protein
MMSREGAESAALSAEGQALIEEYGAIHASRIYGNTSIKNLRFIRPHIKALGPSSILDYGCGRSRLVECLDLGFDVRTLRYDPAIPEFAARPSEVVDLLINVDVLEHVPESDLDAVVLEMRDLCRHALIIVDTRPAALILPNGKNAHCTLHSHDWWRNYLLKFFPAVIPIRAARRSRAAFRTWPLSSRDRLVLPFSRAREDVAYWLARAVFGKERHRRQ